MSSEDILEYLSKCQGIVSTCPNAKVLLVIVPTNYKVLLVLVPTNAKVL